jgi:predicted PurR-regulated permease PerM
MPARSDVAGLVHFTPGVSAPKPTPQEPRGGDDVSATRRLDGLAAARWSPATRALAIVVGTVLAVDGLRLTKPVVLPLFAGVFLAILARPLHLRLRSVLPARLRWFALVVASLAIIAGVGALAGAIGVAGRAVAEEFGARRPQIESQLEHMRRRAERVGVALPRMNGPTSARDTTADAQSRRASAGGSATSTDAETQGSGGSGGQGGATQALRAIATGLGGLGLALGFAFLGLAEAGEVRRRIEHAGRGGTARRTLGAIDEAVHAFRRYVWVKTLTSALTGVVTWLAALAFGLPLAWVWGFLAFLLEYVPSVGSVMAVVPPTLMALADGGPGRAALVLVTIGALQVLLGNVIDPRLEGRLMAISPFGVLLSIVFWGWLWGPVGALLAVPLTVAFVIACRHIPGARGVATIVSGDGVPDD